MCVNEAGHDDRIRCIDNLGVGRTQSRADLDDPAILDKHIALGQISDGLIHREDVSAPDEERTA